MKSFTYGLLTGTGLILGGRKFIKQQTPRINNIKNLLFQTQQLKEEVTTEVVPWIKDMSQTIQQQSRSLMDEAQELKQQLNQFKQDLPD
ncbi:hypothetical protein MOO45_03035 [Bombilactobacillus folatiphilus]|uniref:YtxH domain-containing protein n=1 Tax=Bombilactobacillus folatiphilus TaxID=2923362 RepID=A0ABY4PAK3_9LACO|nr:hypothetical protein [Bombilactobacillus folatiphilus]UQS82635.1 hypothetical protein MOO45_03035 [Bombilactobacillus folatiphilus]